MHAGGMAEPRLLIEQSLSERAEIALDQGQARYVGTVLRLGLGDSVRVFNAADGEWRALVSEKGKRGMAIKLVAFVRAARAVPDLELLFAPVKRHATDLIVEKATELGVRRIRPVITERTIAETVRLDRLKSIAREAAEQTERFDVPEICEPALLYKMLDGWDAERPLIYCDEAGVAAGVLEVVMALFPLSLAGRGLGGEGHADAQAPERRPAPHPPTFGRRPLREGEGGAAVLIGPEGGFTAEERAMLRACAFVTPVSLGPRILRAETAVIAALTIVQAAWGDWR